MPNEQASRGGKSSPDSRQAKKGSLYHFGMKASINADEESELFHCMTAQYQNERAVCSIGCFYKSQIRSGQKETGSFFFKNTLKNLPRAMPPGTYAAYKTAVS